jgi:hypothetical protein
MSKKNRLFKYKKTIPKTQYNSLVFRLKRKTAYQLFEETNIKKNDFNSFYLNILLPFLEFKFMPKDRNDIENWVKKGEIEKVEEIEDALEFLFNSYKNSEPSRWELW